MFKELVFFNEVWRVKIPSKVAGLFEDLQAVFALPIWGNDSSVSYGICFFFHMGGKKHTN